MKSKPRKFIRKSTLITHLDCVMVEITDPAEKAALERRIRAAEKVMVNGYAYLKETKPRKRKLAKSPIKTGGNMP
jgi:hypothetical protein